MTEQQALFDTGQQSAHIAACRKLRRMPPGRFWFRELLSAALEGLWRAVREFEPERGLKFRTFAQHCIQWGMDDWLRKRDRFSRKRRQRGNVPEILPLDQAHTPSGKSVAAILVDPRSVVRREEEDAASMVDVAMRGLKTRLAGILYRHWWEDATYQEIAAEQGVGSSRIAQLHMEALWHCRERLQGISRADGSVSAPLARREV